MKPKPGDQLYYVGAYHVEPFTVVEVHRLADGDYYGALGAIGTYPARDCTASLIEALERARAFAHRDKAEAAEKIENASATIARMDTIMADLDARLLEERIVAGQRQMRKKNVEGVAVSQTFDDLGLTEPTTSREHTS